MTAKTNMGNELLKQMEEDSTKAHSHNKVSMMRIIERDAAGVRRLKWIVITCWVLVIFCFFITSIVILSVKGIESDLQYFSTLLGGIVSITFQAVFLIAVILTILLFVTSRSLTLRQIQARLAEIEKQLKKIAQNK
jgi:uncharacterized membrane protein